MPPSNTSEGTINFAITVGSEKITQQTHPIVSIQVQSCVNEIAKATITVEDGDKALCDFPICNSGVFNIGEEVTIEAGYDQDLETIFEGIIIKQSIRAQSYSDPVLVIECRHAAYRTTLVPKSRSFSDKTDEDIVVEILNDYDLLKSTVTLKSESKESPTHESLVQQEVTDWDFVLLRAEANGGVVMNAREGHKVLIKPPHLTGSAVASFTYGQDMAAMDIHMDARDQWQGVEGHVWEPGGQERSSVIAQDPQESSFGEKSYAALMATNKQKETALVHAGMLAENEMEVLGTGLLQFSRIAKIQGTVVVPGLATIDLGDLISIASGAKNFAGDKAYVSGITHDVSEGKFETTLTLGLPCQRYMRKHNNITSLPAAGMLPPVHGLQIGIVKKLPHEDPQSAYRVGVYLPMVHEDPKDIIWCRMAFPYASEETGFFFAPELESEVTVGALYGDPRSLVILGTLYHSQTESEESEEPEEGAEASERQSTLQFDEPTTKSIITATKNLALHFDDKEGIITLKVPGATESQDCTVTISGKDSSIEIANGESGTISLGASGITLKSKKDLTIDANGAIHLKAGSNITVGATNEATLKGSSVAVKANMKATVEGSSSTEISGGATAIKGSSTVTVEGAIVKIN